MSDARVVLLTGLSAEANQTIAAYAPPGFATTILPNSASDAEKITALRDADFLMIHPGEVSEQVLRSATGLKLVQLLRVGYELMDVRLLSELGIPFAIMGDAFAGMVADHTLMLMLAVYRNLLVSDRAVKTGQFDRPLWGLSSYEMEDKTVGIVGFGNIGRQVAKRVQGFGCNVVYYSRRRIAPDREQALGVTYSGLGELCATSDIVTLHVPITPDTRRLIGRPELRLMKPSTIVVNTSRGEVLDEAALIEALMEGRITGAGLDVFDPQPPLPGNPLFTMDNVVLTPHSASSTVERWPRTAQFAWRNVKNVWEGKPAVAVVAVE